MIEHVLKHKVAYLTLGAFYVACFSVFWLMNDVIRLTILIVTVIAHVIWLTIMDLADGESYIEFGEDDD